jgi:predicted membrane-bound spermidine synthase/Na+-translocating ferredoxin:NAD+ oxidoreductase RnfG subunit
MRLTRGLLIFSYGLFTIGAQTLLFREFVTAFEGNDISVGIFFGAWFLWVGLGAVLIRRWSRLADWLQQQVELLFLLYIPAFLAQLLLTVQVRELAGVTSYDLMSVQAIVLWAMVVNAPVSLVTGALFPVACRWIERTDTFPISHVYVLEAVGSFAGGLAVTALLACHVHTARVFLLLALALLLSVCAESLSRRLAQTKLALGISSILALLSGVGILLGADGLVAQHLRAMKWSKLLPREALEGSFTTDQAEYLYGRYGGQWVVVREGGVCEALPNEEEAGQTAAIALCQNPQAKQALVIGSGLALCHRLLMLPQMEEVAWTHPDTEYAEWLLQRVPSEFGVGDKRFHRIAEEARRYLDATKDHFDIIIVNLPDVTSSAFNRYCTVEFYRKIRTSLRDGGIVSVRIAGGEDTMGAELVSLGASAKKTLENVFSNLVLVPGEQTWLIASDATGLTGDPAVLRDRFAAMEGVQKLFPPAGLLSAYLPDRAARALQSYEKADLPPGLLVNRDTRPLAHLYGLLLAARQSGASVTRFVKLLAVSGWIPFVIPILVFAVLRTWAVTGQPTGRRASSFDGSFVVFSTGWVGIATIIILMYSYETHFGSLYLHVGVISSLFMAGLTAGAAFIGHRIARCHVHACVEMLDPEEGTCLPARQHGTLLLNVLLAHGLLLAAIAFWFTGTGGGSQATWRLGHGAFAIAFLLSGLCCGGYWPIAAAQLAAGRLNSGEAGGRLETADHLGACLGGLATSLLAVPVLGTRVSLLVLIGLLAANVPAAAIAWWKRGPAAGTDESPRLRRAGYALFGVVSCVVLCSNLLAHAGASLQPALPDYAVRALAGEKPTRQASATRKDNGKRATYFVITDAGQEPAGYLFSSADFAPEVRGFGGRLNLAVHIDASGKLIDFLIVRSNETPSYLDLLRGWLDSLKGKSLFARDPFAGVQAVTGATISSQAVLGALQTSGGRFAEEILGGQPSVPAGAPAKAWSEHLPDITGLYLIGGFVAAFLVAHWGGFWSRIVVLTLTFAIGGITLNAQYSSEQIATLLSFEAPAAGLTGVFLFVVGVPLIVLLFGNLYCGYLCPFGAAQELAGYVLPRRLRPAPERDAMRLARFIKYGVLAVLIVAFFVSRDRRTLAGDPLTSVFTLRSALSAWPAWVFGMAGIALIGSLFYVRFWCRYLCPVGAFLSLLNHVRLLRRWVPAKWFGKCEFGLTARDHLDCIYCDRCRHAVAQNPSAPSSVNVRAETRSLVLAAALCGLLIAGVSLNQFRRVMPLILEEPVSLGGTAGLPRDVDVRQIRTLIEQHQLSDRKSEYYKQIE